MVKTRLKKDDQVVVISGNDNGKRGKVLIIDDKKGRVIVEGINKRKKHIKQNQAPEGQKGGILDIEFPINMSNVMYFCDKCKKGVRLGVEVKDKTKTRVCKKCGKRID